MSRLHGKVIRCLFLPLFSRWPDNGVPIGHVTNGVHIPAWDLVLIDGLRTELRRKGCWLGTTETLEQDIRHVLDQRLWYFRTNARKSLVKYARERLSQAFGAAGAPPDDVEAAKCFFDLNALTRCFARRFAKYKGPNLLLPDPPRLPRLLANSLGPVQPIIAGTAHPADHAGHVLIGEWMQFIRRPKVRLHAIFLSDYDKPLTGLLVQGSDIWMNTPRLWEACETSGMEVLVNGGINLSELDGWWAEAYTPEVGSALGDGQGHQDEPACDDAEAEALYEWLKREVILEFYDHDGRGSPTAWVAQIRNSLASQTPRFSANGLVPEYPEQNQLPACGTYRHLAADSSAAGSKFVDWQRAVERNWFALRFSELTVETGGERHVIVVPVFLNGLDPNAVRVEALFSDAAQVGPPVRQEMDSFLTRRCSSRSRRVWEFKAFFTRTTDPSVLN